MLKQCWIPNKYIITRQENALCEIVVYLVILLQLGVSLGYCNSKLWKVPITKTWKEFHMKKSYKETNKFTHPLSHLRNLYFKLFMDAFLQNLIYIYIYNLPYLVIISFYMDLPVWKITRSLSNSILLCYPHVLHQLS